jgi:general secretion pathway protein M
MAAVLAAYTFLVEPIIVGYGATGTQIEEARSQLARFERAAAMRPALVRHMNEIQAQEKSRGYFLAGGTDALAAAALQDQIHALITAKGGTLQSIQPMPGIEEHGLIRVTLRLQMTGTTESMLDVLYALESGSPILFIENLDIENRERAETPGSAEPEATQAASLSIAFDLSGYLQKELE